MKLIIIGAGMAGMLAANMLRRHTPWVVERQQTLPNNHSALLRFRTTAVSDATGVPFRKVKVAKGIWDGDRVWSNVTIPLANAYSLKVTGEVHDRSIWNTDTQTRWLAPPDFVDQISSSIHIELHKPFSFIDHIPADQTVISTLPMPMMMKALDYTNTPEFSHRPIFTIKARVAAPGVHVHQTIYSVAKEEEWYRATLHDAELTVELMQQATSDRGELCQSILHHCFGLSDTHLINLKYTEQKFGKMLPIDEDIRRHFIYWLTESHNIYSLGRFATWRPLLLDDLVKDIKLIESMMSDGNGFLRKLQANTRKS